MLIQGGVHFANSGGRIVSNSGYWILCLLRGFFLLRFWCRAAAHTHHAVCIQADERENVPHYAVSLWRADSAQEDV